MELIRATKAAAPEDPLKMFETALEFGEEMLGMLAAQESVFDELGLVANSEAVKVAAAKQHARFDGNKPARCQRILSWWKQYVVELLAN